MYIYVYIYIERERERKRGRERERYSAFDGKHARTFIDLKTRFSG